MGNVTIGTDGMLPIFLCGMLAVCSNSHEMDESFSPWLTYR